MCENARCHRWPTRGSRQDGNRGRSLSRDRVPWTWFSADRHPLLRHWEAARRIGQLMAGRAALRHLLSCSLTLPLGFNPWQNHSFSVKHQEVGSKGASSRQGLLRTACGTETREINTASVLERKLQERTSQAWGGGPQRTPCSRPWA